MNRLFALILGVFCASIAQAQELLSLDRAIEMALENNNLLLASKKLKDITSNDVTLGNAGFRPP